MHLRSEELYAHVCQKIFLLVMEYFLDGILEAMQHIQCLCIYCSHFRIAQ